MNVQEALATLKSLGTEQNRKIYRRHGAGEDVYGVSFAHLKDLKKKIKTDHELAAGLRSYPETDTLGGLAARAPRARETMARWIASDAEWTASAGWRILAHVA